MGRQGSCSAARRRRRAIRRLVRSALIACCLTAAAVLLGGYSASAKAAAVVALPFPGTPDASPSSEIIFPTQQPGQLLGLTVTGSQSGAHSGQVVALPANRGSAFIPDHAFTPGESVTVSVGGSVASKFGIGLIQATPNWRGSAGPRTSASENQSYASRPDLHPPRVSVSTAERDPGSGDIFLDVQHGRQVGPMILNPQGGLVWFEPLAGGNAAFDVRVQTYQSKPVLTYWEGQQTGTHGGGRDVILDRSYRTVATVLAAEGYLADLHEFVITPQNTALITAYSRVHADLRALRGPRRGLLMDCIVQEIDIASGKLLWEWHALGHVKPSDSYGGRPVQGQPYDFFHLNSVQQLPDGDLLISARNMWAVYLISRATGRILWQLGGKHSSFKIGPRAKFAWQHDAQFKPSRTGGRLTLFDNESAPNEGPQSRAMSLGLDTHTMHAWLIRAFNHTPPLLAASQGDVQMLANGDVFVGWGEQPDFSEYSPGGRQIFSASFPLPADSYRAFRFPWNALPGDPPAAAVKSGTRNAVTVYASWNGATGVASWQLVGGSAPDQLKPLRTARSGGFETALSARTRARYFAVRALDRAGHTLGSSRVLQVRQPK